MSYPHLPATQIAKGKSVGSVNPNPTHRPGKAPLATPITRRYEVRGLTRDGQIAEFGIVAPATPAFEETSSSFAHGTLINTDSGPVAVQDLEPGMMIETVDAGPKMLLWSGSMMLFPDMPGLDSSRTHLTRVTADAFGLSRPMSDLMLGPGARLLYRNSGLADRLGTQAAFTPAQGFEDGFTALSIRPMSPVRVYHLALHGQHIIRANGLEVESFHPGRTADLEMVPQSWELFLTMFPHARCLHDFGPMTLPRIGIDDLHDLRAA
ncbi:Hint domain-containing protein [Actibacterium sp. XHP0104]|uniref:Hint domain-containing protein n=1 Tax=Actibacterium sp. XHP0104 TaxID=2984335 RepID=UPI0021E78DD9|nr:Hint domain-containing protein [Actibacterium sp. XHP0104]MCV2880542.1 Hint domain-containing protein [Actibacterium sp. XHP0104]